jgi:hypothetical protein
MMIMYNLSKFILEIVSGYSINEKQQNTAPSEQFPKSNRRNRGKINITNIYVHDLSLSRLGTGTSIKSSMLS